MKFFNRPLPVGETAGLPSRCILSPMEGVFTPEFVRAVDSLHLTDSWMTPFISVTGGAVPSTGTLKKRLAPWLDNGLSLTVQMIGRDSDSLCRCTENLLKLGIRSLNLNFGCPSKTVIAGGSGGAILDDPWVLMKLTRAVSTMLPTDVLLSVKLRAGNEIDCTGEVVSAAVDGGAAMIIFHYRTVRELYQPVADGLDRLNQAVITAGEIPVIGNGDITDEGSAMKMVLETGCSGVAAARGFLHSPDLLRRLVFDEPDPDAAKKLYCTMRDLGSPQGPLREFARYAFGNPVPDFRRLPDLKI